MPEHITPLSRAADDRHPGASCAGAAADAPLPARPAGCCANAQRPLHLTRLLRQAAQVAHPVVAVVGEYEEEDGVVVVIGSPHLLDQPITPQLIQCQERRVTRNEPLRLVQQVFDVSNPDAGGAVSAGGDDMFAIRAKGDRPV